MDPHPLDGKLFVHSDPNVESLFYWESDVKAAVEHAHIKLLSLLHSFAWVTDEHGNLFLYLGSAITPGKILSDFEKTILESFPDAFPPVNEEEWKMILTKRIKKLEKMPLGPAIHVTVNEETGEEKIEEVP